MGQSPSIWVAAWFPPFSNTALDMFGPLQVKLNTRTLREAQVIILGIPQDSKHSFRKIYLWFLVEMEYPTESSSHELWTAFGRTES